MSAVTGISGIQLSAASAAYAPTNSADVSAIASAYATGKQDALTFGYDGTSISSIDGSALAGGGEQVVTSLQYATSESSTVAATVMADTVVGYGSRDMSAEYPDYGNWSYYDSSSPLIKVRMTADGGGMLNYSSYPYYLYMVPYGATNQGNASYTSQLTGAREYGEFSGDMDDFIIAQGTGSAYSQNPSYVEVTFNVTHVPFWGSQPAWWGTVPEVRRYVVDDNENARPVFCVAGGYDGYDLFELKYNTTAEMDFGSTVTVSAVSGINELGIAGAGGGGGVDSATVSAIASGYAADVSAAASGAVNTVSNYSGSWMTPSSFSGFSGIVTAVGSSNPFTASVSSFMGVDSALKNTTGTVSGDAPYTPYTAQLPDGVSNDVVLSAVSIAPSDQIDITYPLNGGSTSSTWMDAYSRRELVLYGAYGILTATPRNGSFQIDFTARQPEALAFKSDLTGAGGIDSATCSAIASAYAESAVSGKADSSALSSYALSADVSGTVDLVSTQSANWGGSALALSAGPGVKLEKVGDTLVASTDETVLWSGELSEAGTVTAAESLANFEKIELHWHTASGSYPIIDSVHINDNTPSVCFVHGAGASNAWIQWCMCSASANTFTVVRGKSLNFGAYNSTAATYAVSTSLGDSFQLNKIVGINRTAEA